MYWEKPSYLWIQILPGMFLVGWAVSEWLCRRRLQLFGDAHVLGVSHPWIPKVAALVLLLLGITSTAALLAIPVTGEGALPGGSPEIRILLDDLSLDAGGDMLWDNLENAVQVILDQAPGTHFSVLASGQPPEIWVHPTADVGGLRMVVSRLRLEMKRGSGGGLAETLTEYLHGQGPDPPRARLAVITAMPSEDLERLPVMQEEGAAYFIFVILSGDRGEMRFGYRATTGEWKWTIEAAALRDMMKAEIGSSVSWGSLSLMQCYALLAIFLFCAEYVCRRAERSPARRISLSGIALLLIGWIPPALPQSAQAQGTPSDPARTFVSQIARDLAIVTEVSLQDPYVGQQFSIIYRLRAQQPPAAVDIDPQQYAGFWTEVIPISQESASTARPLRGQAVVDFLLRQVVAFPIEEGALQLPPLSIKVKRAGRISAQPDDWDVVGLSAPIEIHSLPLPPGPATVRAVPLVGFAEGSMGWQGDGYTTIALEMQGTANLALFKPLDWLILRPGQVCQAHLVRADNIARTMDLNGKRQLSLVQRQRWILKLAGFGPGQEVDDLVLPVFAPLDGSWKSLRIQGIKLPASPSTAPEPNSGAASMGVDTGMRPRQSQWTVLNISIGLAALAIIGTLLFWLAKKYWLANDRVPDSPAVLEKKMKISPRAFLDGAHKLLEKCALEMGRQHNLGVEDTLLDRCWISVQRYRFNLEPLSVEARNEILSSVRQILNQCEQPGPTLRSR
jgi:hypothetical protein